MEYIQTTKKFVAVLNKKISVGNLMNALGHSTAGLVALYPEVSEMRFNNYIDKNNGIHQSISDNPFIILSVDNSNKIRTLRNELIAKNIPCVDFTGSMTVGTYAEQQEQTLRTAEIDLEYYCIFWRNLRTQ